MQYDAGKHCVFYHRYHIVWSTKYRYKVLTGALRVRVRDMCRQVCAENEADILRRLLSSDHVHVFVSVSPKLAISDMARKMKGRSSYRLKREFPAIRKRDWGCLF
jgi:putative transposase